MSTCQIRHRLKKGLWTEIFPGIYFIGGTLPTWVAKLAAAVMWAGEGAVAGGRSAAWHYRLDGARQGQVEVIGARPIMRAPFRFRHTNYLPPQHMRRKDGIPITTPARTVFDIASEVAPATFTRIATDALRKKIATLGELRAVLRDLQASGRNGTVAVREFLERYDPLLSETANEFEATVLRILIEAKLRLPEPQTPVYDRKGRIARLDFVYRDLKIVIEADGFSWHDDPLAVSRDNDRRNRLMLDGWLVLVFTWDMVMFRPHEVIEKVAEAIRQRS